MLLMQQVLSVVYNDYFLVWMYVMGVDVWMLVNYFLQMCQVQGFEINGNIGVLIVSLDCVINRKLLWFKYQ